MPRINLLPWREEERKRKRQEFYMASVAAIGVAVLTALMMRWHYGSIIDNQILRNKYLTDQIKQIDKQIQEINDLEDKKQSLQSRIKVIEKLQRSRSEVVHVFDQLVRLLPEGVYLTEVKQIERRIQIKGIAESSSRVSALMRNIDGSEWLTEPSLEIVETKGTGNIGASFTLYTDQKSEQELTSVKPAEKKTNDEASSEHKEAA